MILIIQFRKDQSGPHEIKCIHKGISVNYSEYVIINAYGSLTSDSMINIAKDAKGIILGGNGESGYEEHDSLKLKELNGVIVKMKRVLLEVEKLKIPTLGICFGHQLIADYLGGKVELDYEQSETGVNEIILNKNGLKNLLFEGFENKFNAILGHKSSITHFNNENIKVLAHSNKCRVQAFQYKNFYTTQFHPELTLESLEERLRMYPEYRKNNVTTENNSEITTSSIMDNFIKILNK